MASSVPIPESKILKARDPADNDENNWATFDLRNVEVVNKRGKLVNLLHANTGNPVTVTGTLQPLKANARLLLPTAPKPLKNVIMQIKNVTHFAYGAYENGDVEFWVAGVAGWHCIKPAEKYIGIFQEMIEAVNVFYHVADAYKDGARPRHDQLFAKYAENHHITFETAAERIYSHGQFLASRMLKGDEEIKWGHTSFYQHLRKRQPESFGLDATNPPPIKTALPQVAPSRTPSSRSILPPAASTRLTQSRNTSSRTTKLNSTTAARPANARPTRTSRRARLTEAQEQAESKVSESRRSQRTGPLLSEVNKRKARDLWKFMQKTVNNNRPSPADVSAKSLAHSLVQYYTFEDEDRATEFLQCLAADLIPLMQAKRRRAYTWTNLPIYDDLVESKPTAAAKRRMAAIELELRAHPLDNEEDISSADSESSEEEVLDEADIHHSMSVLRPKSGTKFSGKGAKRDGKGKAPQRGESESLEEAEAMDVDTPSKRKSVSEDEDDLHPRKRFTRSQGDHDPELQDLEFEVQQAKSTGLPIRKKSQLNGVKSTIAPVIIAEPIFTKRATEPGDVWTCPREGCLHKVYGASEHEALIKEHYLEHDEVFSLVRSEENRTNLPVSALLKRIREMAESQHGLRLGQLGMGGDDPPMTTIFPAGIMRRV